MYIQYLLNLNTSVIRYNGSGQFELVGQALTNLVDSFNGSGSFEMFGSAAEQALKLKYISGGSFELFGSAPPNIPVKYTDAVKFFINQYGTNYANQKFRIVQIGGSPTNPVYVAVNEEGAQSFSNNTLFSDSEIVNVLTNKYANDIQKYHDKIDYINQKLNTIPLPTDENNLMSLKFNLKDYFTDKQNENNQIISIFGFSNFPNYNSEKQTATNSEALTPTENVGYRTNVYDKAINKYNNKISEINQRLSGLTPPTPENNYTNLKFTINQDLFGYNKYEPIEVIAGNINNKYYVTDQSVYTQENAFDPVDKNKYLKIKYENLLDTYINKLDKINGRLDA
jgi:hypothetical protein